MDRNYANKLLREAVKKPELLSTRKKFWKLDFWPYYLKRCDDILFGDPAAGLAFSLPAPELAVRIAESNPDASGPDLNLLAHSYLGSAYRGSDNYVGAGQAFETAGRYRDKASPKALAEYLRRLAYLRMVQHDPECFPIIEEAITIHKRGNLVNRHGIGECLICRGHAYVLFQQVGRSFDDWTASLNHLSIKTDPKTWYCALHNLAFWAADFGTDEQLQSALNNLRPALVILNTCWSHPYVKLKLRWLMAVIEARLGAYGRAEEVFLEVKDGLVKMKLAYEVGMLQVDLASLYLAQNRHTELRTLVQETAKLFRTLGVEAKAQETLDLWRKADRVTTDLLRQVRTDFASNASPIPSIAA